MKKIINRTLAALLIVGAFAFTACSGVSEEQMAQLEALRSEVRSLEKEVGNLKTEKAAIEREIAEKNAKLEECSKLRNETKKNLEKIGL